MHKIPRTFNKKWRRYTKIEKVFIIYLFILFLLEIFLPFIRIADVDLTFINKKFILSSVIIIFSLIFIILWNISYTFKWFIKWIFWFEYNEAILNFWVLFLHASFLVYSKEIISFIALWTSFEEYKLDYWFYILWWVIILWLIWNLFVALNLSFFNKKKNNYTKIISNSYSEDKNDNSELKSLFDK